MLLIENSSDRQLHSSCSCSLVTIQYKVQKNKPIRNTSYSQQIKHNHNASTSNFSHYVEGRTKCSEQPYTVTSTKMVSTHAHMPSNSHPYTQPSTYSNAFTAIDNRNSNMIRRSKVSLSRSLSNAQSHVNSDEIGESSIYHYRHKNESKDRVGNCTVPSYSYETWNIYNGHSKQPLFLSRESKFEDRNNSGGEFGRISVDSKSSDIGNFRKKYIDVLSKNKIKQGQQKWSNQQELQYTKNTTFDNSLQNSHQRGNQVNKMLDTIQFSFHHQHEKLATDSKPSLRLQKPPSIPRVAETGFPNTSIIVGNSEQSSKKMPPPYPNLHISKMQSLRRIKTLKELDYRQVQSSGGGTSDNHMSMVISIDEDSKAEDEPTNNLSGLDRLLRKSSLAMRQTKTQHLMG